MISWNFAGDCPPRLVDGVLVARAQLTLDVATAEIVTAFDAVAIRAILLKGPVLARWLYRDPTERPYGDIDLLVAPEQFAAAESVLTQLEYTLCAKNDHADDYLRAQPYLVHCDLHRTICWLGVSHSIAWQLLSRDTERITVGGINVEILAAPARALLLALHAAQHGVGISKPLEDLRRALASVDESTWDHAATLARQLGATAAFARGLALIEPGQRLIERLGVSPAGPVELHLRATTAPSTAWALHHILSARSTRERTRLLARTILPRPEVMRKHDPRATNGRTGLAIAYARRPFRLLVRTPSALHALATARRQARQL